MLCSELADVEDDEVFRRLSEFVLSQWRNIRQGKRVRGTSPDGEVNASAPAQVHSLYSNEIGLVVEMDMSGAVLDQPLHIVYESIPEGNFVRTGAASEIDPELGFSERVSRGRVRMDPKAKKSGRPPTGRTTRASEEKRERVQNNAAQDARQALGEVTRCS